MRAAFAIPGDLASLTGGYAYDREIIARAPAFGADIAHAALPASFPAPSSEDLRETARILRGLDRDAVLLIDGLAFGAFTPDLLDALPKRAVALVHHPLALETGVSPDEAQRLAASERAALAHAAHVLVTSAATKDLLAADYGVATSRITVAVPGVARAPRAAGSGGAPHLLAVGSVTPRKGHDVLVEALADLADLDWRLTIVGSPDRAPDFARALAQRIAALGLGARIELAGEVPDAVLQSCYATADLFVMPSLYEGYGMALAEALARGLPIVATTGCAAAIDLPETAVRTLAPGDVAALRDGLAPLIRDGVKLRMMAEAAWTAGQDLPSWDDTARIVAGVLAGAAGGSHA